MLVEALAYSADQLSYQQDAVATEAYLRTARKRISVRRHARLMDYFISEGCNARTWVHLRRVGRCHRRRLHDPGDSGWHQDHDPDSRARKPSSPTIRASMSRRKLFSRPWSRCSRCTPITTS